MAAAAAIDRHPGRQLGDLAGRQLGDLAGRHLGDLAGPIDLRRLEIFARVAGLRSFTRAAAELGLAQPTVSEHVRDLEEAFGVPLLDRLARGAEPTPAGRLVLGYARRMLSLAGEARQAVDRLQGRLAGELVVGGSTIPGEYVLPGLVGRFRADHPEVSIRLLIGDSRNVSDWVDAGRAELGVVGARPARRSLEARALMDDELVLVVPARHRWARRRTVGLAELRREPMVVREPGSGSRAALEQALGDAGAELSDFRLAAEMGSTEAVKRAVRAGVGVALVSRRAVSDECRARLVRCVGVRGLRVARAFYVVVHRERTRSPLADAFLAFLGETGSGAVSSTRP